MHALPSIWRCGIRGRFDFLICFSEVHKKATQIIRDCFLSVRALTEEEIGKVYMSDLEEEELNLQHRILYPPGARKKGEQKKQKPFLM